MPTKTKITYRKLPTGNYVGRYGRYYISIYKRERIGREGWNIAMITLNKEYVSSEGFFGTSLSTIKKAKDWVKSKLTQSVLQ